jgi:hypothetical protein
MYKRLSLVAAILTLAGGIIWAAPLRPFGAEQGFVSVQLEPHSVRTFTVECKANERTAVMAIGRGTTPVGVYVYDVHGNCVAWDDLSHSAQNFSDDIAVAWQPPRQETYEIELRNGGRVTNRVEVAIR